MKQFFFLLCVNIICYADNTQLFNQAIQLGKQNQFQLNLNQNSNITSYGQNNKFESTVAINTNAGTTGANNMYNSAVRDPNYLYNSGTRTIKDCETKDDPRCTTLNKYGDKDTQRQLQAYTQGFSSRYWISTTPDPIDATCSYIHRKAPINNTMHNCTAGVKQQNQCSNTIVPYTEKLPSVPADGVVLHAVGSPGVCGVGQVSGAWIPQGDRAWFTIIHNAGQFDGGSLNMIMGATSQRTPCRGINGSITVVPTTVRRVIGAFYIDWLGGAQTNLTFYQEAGTNCGNDSSTTTCSINITLSASQGGNYTSWNITFDRPKTHNYVKHYQYTKGCADNE